LHNFVQLAQIRLRQKKKKNKKATDSMQRDNACASVQCVNAKQSK